MGDYLLTKDGELYRIINKYTHEITVFYDLVSFRPNYTTYYAQDGHTIEYTQEYTKQTSVPGNRLRRIGMLIAENNAKIAKILYT